MEGSLLARPLVAQEPEIRGYWESSFERTSTLELARGAQDRVEGLNPHSLLLRKVPRNEQNICLTLGR